MGIFLSTKGLATETHLDNVRAMIAGIDLGLLQDLLVPNK